jgi:putative transcriptional regulator
MTQTDGNYGSVNGTAYLDGKLLVAMPNMSDPRFDRAVVYVCAHSADGAMGIVINQPAPHVTFTELLEQLEILPRHGAIKLAPKLRLMSVFVGGPVETGRGFVLHSADYFAAESTLAIDSGVCLTATVDILRAMARGGGPDRALFALGYAGWAPGQLETEIQSNGWLTCPGDPSLVFDCDVRDKYRLALARLGVDPGFLVNDIGHA